MARNPIQEPAFVALREGDIRQLAGDAVFARGEALQRAGHVRAPTIEEDGLQAEVLGTWRRVDRVTVTVEAGQIRSRCTCRPEGALRPSLCRHGAALLLEWVRDRSLFARAAAASEPGEPDSAPAAQEESPLQEYARLLESDTAGHLREIARRRAVRLTGQYKSDLVRNLAQLIGQAESIDAALAGLSDDERVALHAIDLLAATKGHARGAVERAYRALGGSGEGNEAVYRAVEGLVELGLLIPHERHAFPSYAYTVPRVVSARLPPRDLGLRPAERSRAGDAGPRPEAPRLGMAEVFQVVVHELGRGAIGVKAPTLQRDEIAGVPLGWRMEEGAWVRGNRGRTYHTGPVRLLPLPAVLVAADLAHLHQLTGQPKRMLHFALDLMVALHIVQRKGERLLPREDRLRVFLALQPTERLATMVNAWLGMIDVVELRMVADHKGPLHLYTHLSYSWTQAQPQGADLRRLLARLVGRTAPVPPSHAPSDLEHDGTWYDAASLLDLLWNLAPDVLSQGPGFGSGQSWWFADARNPEHRLNLDVPRDWRRVVGPAVAATLVGPMTWLGLVDVAVEQDHITSFRPRIEAAVLVGREDLTADVRARATPGEPLTVETDPEGAGLIVVVPAQASDGMIHTLLARIGELVQASPRGLRYRLMPERVQEVFDEGTTGPDLIRLLASAGGTLPEQVGAALAEWWAGYGTIRLYDELALVELDDDLLLRELLVTSSLGGMLVYTCSPRVVAIDPARVDELLAELTRLGHTPRLVEGP